MGVMLLGKMKIHELAKEIDKTSKEIIAVAQELGLEVKSHMSSLEDNEVKLVPHKMGILDIDADDFIYGKLPLTNQHINIKCKTKKNCKVGKKPPPYRFL